MFVFDQICIRVCRLDQKVSILEAQNPEDLNKRLGLLKTELQSIVNSKSQRESKLIETATSVKDLHKKVNQVCDVSADLPHIVARLKSLEDIHLSSANMNLRLEKLETIAKHISQALENNNQVLTAVKSVGSVIFEIVASFKSLTIDIYLNIYLNI